MSAFVLSDLAEGERVYMKGPPGYDSERSQNALNIRPAPGKSVFDVGPYE